MFRYHVAPSLHVYFSHCFLRLKVLLPPANKGWREVRFSQVCVRPRRGGGILQSQVLSHGPWSQVLCMGYPPGQDRIKYPLARLGYPQPGLGYPPGQGMGCPQSEPPLSPSQNSIISTCYTAGGMPLAVTQEDFLMFRIFQFFIVCLNKCLNRNIDSGVVKSFFDWDLLGCVAI